MPTVTVIVGLVSTLLVGSAMLGSLQAIKSTSLDPNVDRTQTEIDQIGDTTVTIANSDSDMAKQQMQGAIVWNMLAASDCRVLATFNGLSRGVKDKNFEDSDISYNTAGSKAFKTYPAEFLDELSENEGNGYTGNFNDFTPLMETGYDQPCVGTQSTIKQVEDATNDAANEATSSLISGAMKVVGGGIAIAGAGVCVAASGGVCAAAVAAGAAQGASMIVTSDGAGEVVGSYLVPGSSGDMGAEPGFDMEGVFSRMEFETESTFLMGTDDHQDPFLGLALKFGEDSKGNTPGFWRGKRFSYLLPAGLSPDRFDKIDHRILSAGQNSGQEIEGTLCLDGYRDDDCPDVVGSGGKLGVAYVLGSIYDDRSHTLSDPEALRVTSNRIEWTLDNKNLLDDRDGRLQEKLEGVQTKSDFISKVRSDTNSGSTRGWSLSSLLARLLSGEEAAVEGFLKEGESLPDDFPDKDVSGKYSLVRRSSEGNVAELVREDFEDKSPGTQQERKKMMLYSFRPRMENVPIIAGETLTENDLKAGCSDCTDMGRLRNFLRSTSYMFCEGVSGQIQSNAGHIFSSDEATSQEGGVENQVYPKVEIKDDDPLSCLSKSTLSVPDNVNLDCDPEALVEGDSVEVFSRQTAERGTHNVDVVCGTDGDPQGANLGGYGYQDYYTTEETISDEGCFPDWYDITSDSFIKGEEPEVDAPSGVEEAVDIGGGTLEEEDYPVILGEYNSLWKHNYDTDYNDGDGYSETGGEGENNRITYESISADYKLSEAENLTYRISFQGPNSGRVTFGMMSSKNVNRTIIVEEAPTLSKVVVRVIVEDQDSDDRLLSQAETFDQDFSGQSRNVVIDRADEGSISINGVNLMDIGTFPNQIAVKDMEISPIKDATQYNQNYDWGSVGVGELNATQTNMELQNVESYSEPRVCKGENDIWQSKGKDVIGD